MHQKRLKPVSLYPLTPEEAIRHALNAGPLPAMHVNGKHPAKSKTNRPAKKRTKKK